MEIINYVDANNLASKVQNELCILAFPASLTSQAEDHFENEPSFVYCNTKWGQYLEKKGRVDLGNLREIARTNDFGCIFAGGKQCPKGFTLADFKR